jgi:diketogulonate reductase-like aldo/keto reductase
MFDLFAHFNHPQSIKPAVLSDGDSLRPIVIKGRMAQAKKDGISKEESYEMRKKTWQAMEKALKDGKTKSIGVSNYPAELMNEMKDYAEIMPCVN